MAETATKVDSVTFKSPLNWEGSWGSSPIAKRATSTMDLYFYKDEHGFIEWDIPHFEINETIGLVFEFDVAGKRTLVDYDGVFDLPAQALDLLEKNGVDVAEMRKSLAD